MTIINQRATVAQGGGGRQGGLSAFHVPVLYDSRTPACPMPDKQILGDVVFNWVFMTCRTILSYHRL